MRRETISSYTENTRVVSGHGFSRAATTTAPYGVIPSEVEESAVLFTAMKTVLDLVDCTQRANRRKVPLSRAASSG